MDDIPDMSTPIWAPNRKRPALEFDSPEKPSKRPFIEEKEQAVDYRDALHGVEKDGAANSPDAKDRGPADRGPVAGPAPPSPADDTGTPKPLSDSTSRAADGKDKAPQVSDKKVEAPDQVMTFHYPNMQSQHLKVELGGLDDNVFEASNMLCRSPCNDDTLTLQSPYNAEASFVTAKSTLGASAFSSPKPVFKVRPSMGKFLSQANPEAGTTAFRFDPEKFRSLPPLWYKDVEIDFDEDMREPQEAGTRPGDKSPEKPHLENRLREIPDTEQGEASGDKYAVQASAAPLTSTRTVRGPACNPFPVPPTKTHLDPASPFCNPKSKAAPLGPTVAYDKTGTALFPTKDVLWARLHELYPGIFDMEISRFPKDRPRWDHFNKLQNLVFNQRVLLERTTLKGGSPRLSVEHHSKFAKSVFAQVTAWRCAKDKDCQDSQLPPLPLHMEILAVKLLSNDNKHHNSVLRSLTGTSQEWLLEPIPSAYGRTATLHTAPSTTPSQPPPPKTPLPPRPDRTAGPSVRHTAPQLSTQARDKIASLGIANKHGHSDKAMTLDKLIAHVQKSMPKDPGQSLAETLNLIRQQQDTIHKTMKVLQKTLLDAEKLQVKQDNAVSRAVNFFEKFKIQQQQLQQQQSSLKSCDQGRSSPVPPAAHFAHPQNAHPQHSQPAQYACAVIHPSRLANIADSASVDHGHQQQTSPKAQSNTSKETQKATSQGDKSQKRKRKRSNS